MSRTADDPEQIKLLERVLYNTGWWRATDLPRYPGAPNVIEYHTARATEVHRAMKKLKLKVVPE